jgi:hypothetical protein
LQRAGAVKGAPLLRGEALPLTASDRCDTINVQGKGAGTLPRVSAVIKHIPENRYNIPSDDGCSQNGRGSSFSRFVLFAGNSRPGFQLPKTDLHRGYGLFKLNSATGFHVCLRRNGVSFTRPALLCEHVWQV